MTQSDDGSNGRAGDMEVQTKPGLFTTATYTLNEYNNNKKRFMQISEKLQKLLKILGQIFGFRV